MLEEAVKVPNPWNALTAAARAAKQVVQNKPLTVSQATVDQRITICRGCEFFDPQTQQCKVCTCFVPLKAQLATEKCPKGRWPFTSL